MKIEEKTKRVEEDNEKLRKAASRLQQLIESNDIDTIVKEQAELFGSFAELSPVSKVHSSPPNSFTYVIVH